MMYAGKGWLVAAAAAVIIFGCSDDDNDGKITPDGATADMTPVDTGPLPPDSFQVPDGYGALYSCTKVGQACNAHNPCALNPICGPDKKCRPSGLQNCDDKLACTTDVCAGLGVCTNKPKKDACKLAVRVGSSTADAGPAPDGGAATLEAGVSDGSVAPDSGTVPTTTEERCFKKDDKKPSDPCMACLPDTSQTKWSGISGGKCDDNESCTKDDTCIGGICKGTSFLSKCADSYHCTKEICDGKGGCKPSVLKSGYCLINKTCYKDGGKHPTGSCFECDVTKSTTAWTAIGNTCLISGKCYKKGDKNTGGCAQCDPASSSTKWTVKGTTHCLINNLCVASGKKDSTGCSVCTPATNKYAYTALSGLCKIATKCYKKGDKNTGGCAECDPTTSSTKWTVKGTTHCLISNKCLASGTADSTGCASCVPASSKYGWTAKSGMCKIAGKCYSDGTAHAKGCAKCVAATSGTSWTLTSKTDCLINHECYKAKATFGCFQCDPAKSQTAWTQISGCKNLETSAKATSSGGGSTSAGYGPELMNDGKMQSSCKAHWVSASSSASSKWIQLTWAQSVVVGQVKFDTQPVGSSPCVFSAGRTLAGGTLQYWKSGAWTTISKISGKTDDWGHTFTPVTTDKIRLYGVHSSKSSNPVIYEWQVFSK